MGDSADLVKVLRRKCDDLEDELDEEKGARDEALAAKAEVEEEIANLRKVLQAEREARQLEDVKAGQGKQVLERLQTTLKEEQQRTAELRRELDGSEAAKLKLEEQLQEHVVSRDGAKEEVALAETALTTAQEVGQASEKRAQAAEAAIAEHQVRSETVERELEDARTKVVSVEANLKNIEDAKVDMEAKLEAVVTEGRKLEEDEVNAASDAMQQISLLEGEVQEQTKKVEELSVTLQALSARRQELAAELQEADSEQQAFRGKSARAEEELELAKTICDDLQSRVDEAEKELEEVRQAVEHFKEEAAELTTDRDCSEERMQEAERSRDELRAKIATAEQEFQDRDAAIKTEIQQRCAPLEEALREAKERNKHMQRAMGEMEMSRRQLEDEFRVAVASHAATERDESQVQANIAALQEEERECTGRDSNAEKQLAEARLRLNSVDKELTELKPELQELIAKVWEADKEMAEEEQQVVQLQRELEAERSALEADSQRVQELERKHEACESGLAAQKLNLEALTSELEAERAARQTEDIAAQCGGLGRRIEELLAEGEHERNAADKMGQELEAERSEHATDAAQHEEFRHRCDELRSQIAEADAEAERFARLLQDEHRRRVDNESSRKELEVAIEACRSQWSTDEQELDQVKSELDQVVAARDEMRRRADELQDKFDAVQPEHEDLFARYSEVIEQIDAIKGENRKLSRESENLRASIAQTQREVAEALQQKEAVESAPPTQIAVSDVLISVSVDGASVPLELRPWDTNFDLVVSDWLVAEQKAPNLQDCLVKYLRHLEDTAETFPVRTQAKLQELHEQFAN
mmetsp:Transcript_87346/g.250296  ORF Transcript_87346/g.250296 Transcript_87346/m.250296 type:complete len:820 (+) Transcript_87346:52-2511(+)